jgi:hypothetical protein
MGVDIVNDTSGATFDPSLIKYLAQSNIPLIISASGINLKSNMAFIDSYIDKIKKQIDFYQNKGILNSNIAIDINLDIYNNKFVREVLTNFNKFNENFDNIKIGSASLALESEKDFILNNKINLIRIDNLKQINNVMSFILNNSTKSDDLGSIHKVFKNDTSIRSLDQIPRYQFKNTKAKQEILNDSTNIEVSFKKEDELSLIIRKLSQNKESKTE